MKLIFKKCSKEDFEDFYILRCDKENIYWTGHNKEPNKDNLYGWYMEQLKRDDRIMFIVKADELDEPAGYLYLDIIENEAGIGYGVNSVYKNNGFGTKIISYSKEYVLEVLLKDKKINKVFGWIFEENYPSIKCFLKNGFVKTNEKKEQYMKSVNRHNIMFKYIFAFDDKMECVN